MYYSLQFFIKQQGSRFKAMTSMLWWNWLLA